MPTAVSSDLESPPTPKPTSPPARPKWADGLPRSIIEAAGLFSTDRFDPQKHLNYELPAKIISLEDIGLGNVGVSPMAISEPFSLFTKEAIRQLRAEAFSDACLKKYHLTFADGAQMVRGYCPEYGRFAYDAWNHPETLAFISKVAGIELVPAFDYDTSQINISLPSAKPDVTLFTGQSESSPAFNWHYDSFPFVCVTMLSDTAGMIGGETAIRTGYDETIKVRGPKMGRHVQHSALTASGCAERVTMVTALRPKSPLIRDSTVLDTVRGVSDLPTLLAQYPSYRLDNLEERVREQLRKLRKQMLAGITFDAKEVKRWLMEQREYLDSIILEMDGGHEVALGTASESTTNIHQV